MHKQKRSVVDPAQSGLDSLRRTYEMEVRLNSERDRSNIRLQGELNKLECMKKDALKSLNYREDAVKRRIKKNLARESHLVPATLGVDVLLPPGHDRTRRALSCGDVEEYHPTENHTTLSNSNTEQSRSAHDVTKIAKPAHLPPLERIPDKHKKRSRNVSKCRRKVAEVSAPKMDTLQMPRGRLPPLLRETLSDGGSPMDCAFQDEDVLLQREPKWTLSETRGLQKEDLQNKEVSDEELQERIKHFISSVDHLQPPSYEGERRERSNSSTLP